MVVVTMTIVRAVRSLPPEAFLLPSLLTFDTPTPLTDAAAIYPLKECHLLPPLIAARHHRPRAPLLTRFA